MEVGAPRGAEEVFVLEPVEEARSKLKARKIPADIVKHQEQYPDYKYKPVRRNNEVPTSLGDKQRKQVKRESLDPKLGHELTEVKAAAWALTNVVGLAWFALKERQRTATQAHCGTGRCCR